MRLQFLLQIFKKLHGFPDDPHGSGFDIDQRENFKV